MTKESARIFIRKEASNQFKQAFDSTLNFEQDRYEVSSIGQPASSLNHITTHQRYRYTLNDFDEICHQPVTIFTLCDTPSNHGYGCSANSFVKTASLFLQIIAIRLQFSDVLTTDNLSQFKTYYEAAKTNQKSENED